MAKQDGLRYQGHFLPFYVICGMTSTYSSMQCAALCFLNHRQQSPHCLSSSIAPYSLKLSLSVMVVPSAVCYLLPCSPGLLLVPQCSRTSRNLVFWWFWFFNLWGCGPVIFVVLTFTNRAKFGEMFLPALQRSHIGAVAVTLARFKPILLQAL